MLLACVRACMSMTLGAATDVWIVPTEQADEELKTCTSEWMFEDWG